MSFRKESIEGILLWTGDPSCDAGHSGVLTWLKAHLTSFLGAPPEGQVIKGNLGETIAFFVGETYSFSGYKSFAANARNPLNPISKSDIDIVWILFGSDGNDLAYLEEIKTTGDASLRIAHSLVSDYAKLFGTNPALQLPNRLQAIKNEIEYGHRMPELCQRVSRLSGQSPRTSPSIRLVPTVVHERTGCDPREKLTAVRSALCSQGWPPESVSAWSIALSDLDDRLIRLAMGLE